MYFTASYCDKINQIPDSDIFQVKTRIPDKKYSFCNSGLTVKEIFVQIEYCNLLVIAIYRKHLWISPKYQLRSAWNTRSYHCTVCNKNHSFKWVLMHYIIMLGRGWGEGVWPKMFIKLLWLKVAKVCRQTVYVRGKQCPFFLFMLISKN